MHGIPVLLQVRRAAEVGRAVGAGVPLPLPSFWQGNLLLLLLLAGDGGDGGDGGAALRILLLLLLATGTNTDSKNHAKHHPHEHLARIDNILYFTLLGLGSSVLVLLVPREG